MLTAAFFLCLRAIGCWQVPHTLSARGAMALWFFVLLAPFEMLVGIALFGRTLTGTWARLATPAGLIGQTAQIVAALLPLFVGGNGRR